MLKLAMESILVLELLILFCMIYVRVSLCFNTTVGFFRKVGQHPQLSMCAIALFRKHEYEGMLIHDETGVCEGLPRGAIDKTTDNQYAYVKRLKTEHIFQPPLEYSNIFWKLPGLFRNGARLTVVGRMPEGYVTSTLNLHSVEDGNVPLHLKIIGNYVSLSEMVHHIWHRRSTPGTVEKLNAGRAFTFAFVAEENSIMVFLNDEHFQKHYLVTPLIDIALFQGHAFSPNLPLPAISMLKFVNDIE